MHASTPARASGAASPLAHHGALVRADQYREEARASRRLSGATLGAVAPPTSFGGGRLRCVPGTRTGMVIRGHQRSSEVIRGHQRSSEVIRGHQRPSIHTWHESGMAVVSSEHVAIGGHQRSSGS